MKRVDGCPLCSQPDDAAKQIVVARAATFRVVRVTDAPAFPAFYRVIWDEHVAEFSDLDAAQRVECMEAVVVVERALRVLDPTKINLAALGNVVPHLHWHVVARFVWDSHFPEPIWGTARRQGAPNEARLLARLPELDVSIRSGIAALGH